MPVCRTVGSKFPGGGGAEYKANIIDGTAETKYCIVGDPSPGCVSAVWVIDPLMGNQTGTTGSGIDERLLLGGTPCDGNSNGKDEFGEVFLSTGALKPAYTVACPRSPRVIIIPIVNYLSAPVNTVIIRGWALAYLDSYSCNNCNGTGHWAVKIEIADAAYSQAAGFLRPYDPTSSITLRRLIE